MRSARSDERERSFIRPAGMPSPFLSLVAPALIAAACISGSYGQTPSPTFTIYGIVRLPDGSPAPRVVVQVTSQTSPSLEVFTNDLGRYEISSLPRGHYWLTAIDRSDPGIFSDAVEVETGRTSPPRLLINLYLRAGPKALDRKQDKGSTISLKEAAQNVPKSARKAFEQAQTFRSKNRSDRALDYLNRAIEIFPQYFQALAERGHLRVSMMQPTEAAADFARALELNDRYEPALRGLGICYFQDGRLEDAIVYFERAVSEAPSNAVDRLFLGICNARLGRSDVARAALHRALAIDPIGAARAHVYLAHLSIQEDKPQDAIAELEAYLTALPGAPDADSQRGLILRLRKQLTKN